MIFCSFSYPF